MQGAKALEAQTEAIKEMNSGNQALVDKVQEVAVEEAKKRVCDCRQTYGFAAALHQRSRRRSYVIAMYVGSVHSNG